MFGTKSWFLIGLLGAACFVPDVEVASPTDSEGGDTSTGAGPSSTGGKSTSGSPNIAGSDTGASPAGGSGATPSDPGATGKFCNDIPSPGLTLTLEIGTGSKRVLLSAVSGSCTPVSGLACKAIPTGTGIPVSLLDGSDAIISYPVDIADGDAWIFLAYTDGENVDIAGDSVTSDVCELGYDAPSSPDSDT